MHTCWFFMKWIKWMVQEEHNIKDEWKKVITQSVENITGSELKECSSTVNLGGTVAKEESGKMEEGVGKRTYRKPEEEEEEEELMENAKRNWGIWEWERERGELGEEVRELVLSFDFEKGEWGQAEGNRAKRVRSRLPFSTFNDTYNNLLGWTSSP